MKTRMLALALLAGCAPTALQTLSRGPQPSQYGGAPAPPATTTAQPRAERDPCTVTSARLPREVERVQPAAAGEWELYVARLDYWTTYHAIPLDEAMRRAAEDVKHWGGPEHRFVSAYYETCED